MKSSNFLDQNAAEDEALTKQHFRKLLQEHGQTYQNCMPLPESSQVVWTQFVGDSVLTLERVDTNTVSSLTRIELKEKTHGRLQVSINLGNPEDEDEEDDLNLVRLSTTGVRLSTTGDPMATGGGAGTTTVRTSTQGQQKISNANQLRLSGVSQNDECQVELSYMQRHQRNETDDDRMRRKIQARSQPKPKEANQSQNMSFRESRRMGQLEEELKDDSSRGGSKVFKSMGNAIMQNKLSRIAADQKVFQEPVKLIPQKVVKTDLTETQSSFKLCLWELKRGHSHDKEILSNIVASQTLNFNQSVVLLHERTYLSADQRTIFLLVIDQSQTLSQVLLFKSVDLQKEGQHDLSHLGIQEAAIACTPSNPPALFRHKSDTLILSIPMNLDDCLVSSTLVRLRSFAAEIMFKTRSQGLVNNLNNGVVSLHVLQKHPNESTWLLVTKDLIDQDALEVQEVTFTELEKKIESLGRGQHYKMDSRVKGRVLLTDIASDQFNHIETLKSRGGSLYLKVSKSEALKVTSSIGGRQSSKMHHSLHEQYLVLFSNWSESLSELNQPIILLLSVRYFNSIPLPHGCLDQEICFIVYNEHRKAHIQVMESDILAIADTLEDMDHIVNIEEELFSGMKKNLFSFTPEMRLAGILTSSDGRYLTLLSVENSGSQLDRAFLAQHYLHADEYDKHDHHQSLKSVIGQGSVHFLNPWVIRVTDRTCIHLANVHFPKVHFTLTLEQEFVQAIDLCHGKIQLNPNLDHFIYRHQFFAFLVYSLKDDKISIMLLELPSLFERLSDPQFEYERDCQILLHKISMLDLIKGVEFLEFYNSEKVLKAAIGWLRQANEGGVGSMLQAAVSRRQFYLVIQLSQELLVLDIKNKKHFTFDLASTIPFSFFPASQSMLSFFFYNQASACIECLRILPNEEPQLTKVFSFKTKLKVLSMQACRDSNELLVLDEKPSLTRLSLEEQMDNDDNPVSLKVQDEYRFTEDLKQKLQAISVLSLTEHSIYTGIEMYQTLRKGVEYKDHCHLEFELQRQKRLEPLRRVGDGQLVQGPVMDLCGSYLAYVCLQVDKDDRTSSGIIQQYHGRTIVGKHAGTQVGQAKNLVIHFLPKFEHNELDLLPKDDYLKDFVSFSTFTLHDDILLMVKQQFLIFTMSGRALKIKICEDSERLISSKKLELVQIKALQHIKQGLVFRDSLNYHIFELSRHYSAQSREVPYQLMLKATYPILNLESQIGATFKELYAKARCDTIGNLYQVVIIKVNQTGNIVATAQVNDDKVRGISMALRQTMEERIAEEEQQNRKKQVQVLKKAYLQSGRSVVDDSQRTELLKREGRVQGEDKNMYGFEIIHDRYFVFKCGNSVYFKELINRDFLAEGMDRVKVNLREGLVTELHQTQKSTHLQFIFVQYSPVLCNYIFTWDLQSNMEQQLLELPFSAQNQVKIQIFKGVSERLNYYLPELSSYIYDIRYEYPMNFFSGARAHFIPDRESSITEHFRKPAPKEFYQQEISNRNELKLSSSALKMLGVSRYQKATLQLSYNPLNLQYLEYLFEYYRIDHVSLDDVDDNNIILKYLRFQLKNGENILHLLQSNLAFLQNFQKEVSRQANELENEDALNLIYYVLFPDVTNESPFSSVLTKNYSPRCVEQLLTILQLNDNYNYFMHIKHHFFRLLEMKSRVFEQFFDQCTDQLSLQMRCVWKFKKDQAVFLTHHTQYLSQEFIGESLKIKEKDIEVPTEDPMLQQGLRQTNISNQMIQHLRSTDTCPYTGYGKMNEGLEFQQDPLNFLTNMSMLSQQTQQIAIYTYDYGWLLRGKTGQEFMEFLANQNSNSEIFKLKSIQTIINVQWKNFRLYYRNWQFFPFCAYFILLILFNTIYNPNLFTLQQKCQFEAYRQSQDDNKTLFSLTHEILGYSMIIFAAYFILQEIRKLSRRVTWFGYFQLTFHTLVVFLFLIDRINQWTDKPIFNIISSSNTPFEEYLYIILASILIIFAYLTLLIHLRTFEMFAVLINLIFQVMKDTMTFAIIFFIIIFAFGNAMFVLAMLERPDKPEDKITGPDLLSAFMFVYRGTLGELFPDDINKTRSSQVFSIFQIFQTLLLNVMTLNLLVSILSDIHSKVMSVYKSERLRGKCRLINENEVLFDREKLFRDTKYVVRAEIEQVEDREKGGSDGSEAQASKFDDVIAKMKQIVGQSEERTLNQFRMVKTQVQDLGAQFSRKEDEDPSQPLLLKLNELQEQIKEIQLHLHIERHTSNAIHTDREDAQSRGGALRSEYYENVSKDRSIKKKVKISRQSEQATISVGSALVLHEEKEKRFSIQNDL